MRINRHFPVTEQVEQLKAAVRKVAEEKDEEVATVKEKLDRTTSAAGKLESMVKSSRQAAGQANAQVQV